MIAHYSVYIYQGCNRIRTRFDPPCQDCEDWIFEAWERMTYGGLSVPRLPGYPYAHAVETPTLSCEFCADFGPSEWT